MGSRGLVRLRGREEGRAGEGRERGRGRGRGRGGSGKGGTHTNADGPLAGLGVVGMRIEPDEVGDPVCVAVAGDDDGVVDVVVVEGSEGAVAVGLVAVLRDGMGG